MRYGAFSIADAKVQPFFKLANFFSLFFEKSFLLLLKNERYLLANNQLGAQQHFAAHFMPLVPTPLDTHYIIRKPPRLLRLTLSREVSARELSDAACAGRLHHVKAVRLHALQDKIKLRCM